MMDRQNGKKILKNDAESCRPLEREECTKFINLTLPPMLPTAKNISKETQTDDRACIKMPTATSCQFVTPAQIISQHPIGIIPQYLRLIVSRGAPRTSSRSRFNNL